GAFANGLDRGLRQPNPSAGAPARVLRRPPADPSATWCSGGRTRMNVVFVAVFLAFFTFVWQQGSRAGRRGRSPTSAFASAETQFHRSDPDDRDWSDTEFPCARPSASPHPSGTACSRIASE